MKKAIIALAAMLVCTFFVSAQTANKLKELYNQQDFEQAKTLITAAVKESPKDQQLLIMCGDIYADYNLADSAQIMYEKALSVKDDASIVRKVAKAYAQKNKMNEAHELLQDLMKKDNDVINSLAMADLLIQMGGDSIKKAEMIITTAKNKNPKLADPAVSLGDLYFVQKVYELAKDNYEAALAINPKLAGVRAKLATSYYWMANREDDKTLMNELFNKCLEQWTIITKDDPKNARAYFEQGRLFFFAKKWAEASNALAEYVRMRPSASQTRWWLAQSLVERAENVSDSAVKAKILDSAIVHLNICAAEIDSVKPQAKGMIAKALYTLKRYDQAITAFSELENMPNFVFDASNYERFAWSYFRNSPADTAKALNYLHKSLDLDKSKCGLMNSVARLHFSRKEYTEAIKYFKNRIAYCGDDKNISQDYFFTGYTFLRMFDPENTATLEFADSAKPYLEQSLKLDPNNLSALISLGDAYSNSNNTDKAKEIYLDAADKALKNITKYGDLVKADPANKDNAKSFKTAKDNAYQAYTKMYGMFSKEKKFKEFLTVLKQWIAVDPENTNALLYTAICYHNLEDKDNACKYYREVLKIDPNDVTAKKNAKNVCQ